MDISELQNQYADRYLVYNRRSTDDPNNQKNSLVYQRNYNVAFAKNNKLPIAPLSIAGFCENGIIDEMHSAFKEELDFDISAEGFVQHRVLRPKFLALVGLLKEKKVKGVVFLCWDRASRNGQDDILLKKLSRLGSDIRFTETKYEDSSAGELHKDIDGTFAAHYSRSISEKVRHGQKKLRDEGKCIYNAPLGYFNEGSDNKPFDPERAPIVKRIFELYATGEWSFVQLAKWAREQGLTKRAVRRRRSRDEKEANLDLEGIPKISRPVDHKTIEFILNNPFYIGKVKIAENEYIQSVAHQPLIDNALFQQVQKILKLRCKTIHYIDKPFFAYRGLARCTCGRSFSPYLQKGYNYYRSRCKEGCDNPDVNISEDEMTTLLGSVLDQIHFTDEELAEIEVQAKKQLAAIAEKRSKKLSDLYGRHKEIMKNIEYMTENRITLMRTGAMAPDEIAAEEARLNASRNAVEEQIRAYGESAQEMLQYVITFSELVRNASLYFKHALDSEKREIVTQVFSEITIRDRALVNYGAKDGFDALLTRKRVKGGG